MSENNGQPTPPPKQPNLRLDEPHLKPKGTLSMRDPHLPKPRPGVAAKTRPNTVNTRRFTPARILYPALGCPAVISPGAADGPFATRGLCLLIASKVKLTEEDVAHHLRLVPWADRHERFRSPDQPGSFEPDPLEVYDAKSWSKGPLVEVFSLGANVDGEEGAYLGLSNHVRRFYAKHKLTVFNEVRIQPEDLAKFGTGLFQVYWINSNRRDTSEQRSDNMELLITGHAEPTRQKEFELLPMQDMTVPEIKPLIDEYEYEYRKPLTGANRTELLHPVFIEPPKAQLRVGHLTDTHVHTKADAYERNLASTKTKTPYNNWNKDYETFYNYSKAACDILLMTGDLVDYGRGYNERESMGEDSSYWRDRNWFQFYELTAGGMKYTRPAFTILGNHDWRINPYPPFAMGAPGPGSMNLTKEELVTAHGAGHEPGFMYTDIDLEKIASGLGKKIGASGKLDVKDTPIETTEHSVAWYLLLINPFLDYLLPLPGGYDLLMLDWGRDEEVDLDRVYRGRNYGKGIYNGHGGPRAYDSLSPQQKQLAEQFLTIPRPAKLFGIHAPVIGPWPEWKDADLEQGKVRWKPGSGELPRGAVKAERVERDGKGNVISRTPVNEHYALAANVKTEPEGQVADQGSFLKERDWLVRALHRAKVSAVFTGHIHRTNNFFIVGGGKRGNEEMLIVRHVPSEKAHTVPTPLFVNTTSAGPRGHIYGSLANPETTTEPGYTEVVVARNGGLVAVESKLLGKLPPRQPATPPQPTPAVAPLPPNQPAQEPVPVPTAQELLRMR